MADYPAAMAIIVAFMSSVVTGALIALGAYAVGVYRQDILLALGLMAGGIQMGCLILWYLLAYSAPLPSRSDGRNEHPESLEALPRSYVFRPEGKTTHLS
jgi:hypothetical protein